MGKGNTHRKLGIRGVINKDSPIFTMKQEMDVENSSIIHLSTSENVFIGQVFPVRSEFQPPQKSQPAQFSVTGIPIKVMI